MILILVPNTWTLSIMGNGKSPKTKCTLFLESSIFAQAYIQLLSPDRLHPKNQYVPELICPLASLSCRVRHILLLLLLLLFSNY